MDTVEVPLEIRSQGFVIFVDIGDEHELPFVLDTGSTGTSIDDDVARRLGLESQRELRSYSAGGRSSIRDQLSTPVEVRIGSDRWTLPLVISNLDEPDAGWVGIIGLDVLRDRDFEVDARAGVLRIHPPGAAACQETPPGFARVETRPTWIGVLPPFVIGSAGLLRIEGTLDGEPVSGVLDLGAGGTLVNHRAAARSGIDTRALVPASGVSATDAEGRSLSVASAGFDELRIGTASWALPGLYVADIPPFRLVHLHRRPAVWFGGDLFIDRPLWLCLPEHAVLIGE